MELRVFADRYYGFPTFPLHLGIPKFADVSGTTERYRCENIARMTIKRPSVSSAKRRGLFVSGSREGNNDTGNVGRRVSDRKPLCSCHERTATARRASRVAGI